MRRREKPEYHGWYKFRNIAGAELVLQVPLPGGRNIIPKDGEFETDSRCLNIEGLKLLASLGKNEDEKIHAAALIVDTPSEKLEFFEADGSPIEESAKTTIDRAGQIDISKKELIEFARLKGVEFNPNWSKTKILCKIRE